MIDRIYFYFPYFCRVINKECYNRWYRTGYKTSPVVTYQALKEFNIKYINTPELIKVMYE